MEPTRSPMALRAERDEALPRLLGARDDSGFARAGRTDQDHDGAGVRSESRRLRPWRTVAVPVTSARDSVEHLVHEEAMAPGNAGRCVALCGHAVLAAALVCPPGPRCPSCTAVRNADPVSERRPHRQHWSGVRGWLKLVRRPRHRGAGANGGASDAD